MSDTDTIFALSSGPLPAGVAVVRLSGPKVRETLKSLTGSIPEPRVAVLRSISTASSDLLDRGVVMFFPEPSSFTGEDIAELHLHGSRAVVSALLRELASRPGLRHAEAGEFTRRAFLHGKVDLPRAEALADLVNAETEAQRRLALQNAEGGQTALYEHWRHRIIHARAMIEAELDFADEQDVPGSVAETVWMDVGKLVEEIAEHVAGYHRSEIIRDGFDVVIVGAPNAGKSSLLNALAKRDVAIVSEEAGTTRDLIEVALDLNGLKVRITDTAGLRDDAGRVEAIGIARARERAAQADLVIVLNDLSDGSPPTPAFSYPGAIVVGTKADLVTDGDDAELTISTVSGAGLAKLLARIEGLASAAIGNRGDILPTRLRQLELLKAAEAHLQSAAVGEHQDLELRAESLRLASDAIGRISGRVDVEDLLDVIFSQFCIGK